MKALSIRQPFAHAIVALTKRVENRGWCCKYRGPILIHAGKQIYQPYPLAVGMVELLSGLHQSGKRLPPPEKLPRGGIVGMATIVDCWGPSESRDPWHMAGCFGIVLADVKELPFTPCRGAVGFFEVERFEGGTP